MRLKIRVTVNWIRAALKVTAGYIPAADCVLNIKGAVCRILTLLKHKNTIICLQTFRKHVKLTYLFN